MKAETKKTPKRMIEQRFLDHIADGYKAGQRYCFVLGAGAAKASGIRTGMEMMREWRAYLLDKGRDYIRDCAQELGLEEEEYLPLFDDGYNLKNDDYFTVFDLRFAGEPNVAYAYLEKEMEGKYPSYGYFPLAKILSHTENRLVITTNFDTLLEDALYTYTFKHPLVVGHESLASYIGSDFRRPVIAKIHRDLLFRPFNRKQDMDQLKDEWVQPLRNALSRYTPIVIGYAGGDHTFMTLLEEISLNNGIYWCHLENDPSENAQNIVAKQNGYLVKILGFDEIMFRLGDRFAEEAQFGDPCAYIQEEADKRCSLYRESLEKIKEKYDLGKSAPEEVPDAGESGASQSVPGGGRSDEAVAHLMGALDRYDSRQAGGKAANEDVKELESEARRRLASGDYEEALPLYTQLIEKYPENPLYYDRRSTVLHNIKRYPEAVRDNTRAIELDPDNAAYYHSRAVTLHAMKEYEQALADRTKAIELDPSNAHYYNQRAITFHAMKRYEQALADRDKAIELRSNNAEFYHGRAVTLHAMKQYEQALADRDKAIELDPTKAKFYSGRARTLRKLGRDAEAEQDEQKAKELSSDPGGSPKKR